MVTTGCCCYWYSFPPFYGALRIRYNTSSMWSRNSATELHTKPSLAQTWADTLTQRTGVIKTSPNDQVQPGTAGEEPGVLPPEINPNSNCWEKQYKDCGYHIFKGPWLLNVGHILLEHTLLMRREAQTQKAIPISSTVCYIMLDPLEGPYSCEIYKKK